jgi:hypothetical protein
MKRSYTPQSASKTAKKASVLGVSPYFLLTALPESMLFSSHILFSFAHRLSHSTLLLLCSLLATHDT